MFKNISAFFSSLHIKVSTEIPLQSSVLLYFAFQNHQFIGSPMKIKSMRKMPKTTFSYNFCKIDVRNLKYGRCFIMNSAMNRHIAILSGKILPLLLIGEEDFKVVIGEAGEEKEKTWVISKAFVISRDSRQK